MKTLQSQSCKRSRALVYGCFVEQGEWETVEGESLNWEEDILQNEEELAENGLNMYVDSRESCREIAEHYCLSLWGS